MREGKLVNVRMGMRANGNCETRKQKYERHHNEVMESN